MMLLITCIALLMVGGILTYLSLFLYQMTQSSGVLVFMLIISFFVTTTPWILTTYRIMVSKTYKRVEKTPKWKHLIDYHRRDNVSVDLYGTRAYPGESFIDVPDLGLVEFLGKDCYYNKGDKTILYGLENINYTPDIRYSNLTHILWELGFINSDEVKNVLSGNDLKKMGEVAYKIIDYDANHGPQKLTEELQNYDGKKRNFNPRHRHNKNQNTIDNTREVAEWHK